MADKKSYKIVAEYVVIGDTEAEAWDKYHRGDAENTWISIQQQSQTLNPAYLDPETLTFDQEDKEHPRR